MNTQEIEKRTIRVISEQCYCHGEKDKIKPESTFRGDLGCDSLDEIELVMALEEEFEIDISDDDAEKISTVGEAVAYLATRVTPNAKVTGSPALSASPRGLPG